MTKVVVGVNDLATTNPELLKEWHPTKNGNLRPTDITAGSKKKVWWLLSYDDSFTGMHFDFEWEMTVCNRTIQKQKCPFLSGRALYRGFNDLETRCPEIANEWHPTKNGKLKPCDVTEKSTKDVWWLLPFDDPKTGLHFDFEWKAKVYYRTSGHNCPYLVGKEVWIGFNDLMTVNPELSREWHPTRNGSLRPSNVTAGSGKKVWWLLPYDDPSTGKHFDFEWQDTISHRQNGRKCPFVSGKAVWRGFNDLETACPDLAKEWHPTKNGNLRPTDVSAGSNQKVWWYKPYDDPNTGKHFDFEWQAIINNRANKDSACPFLSNVAVWPGYNDLATKRPDLSIQWHPTKNGSLKPSDVLEFSMKKIWWYLPYDDPKTEKHYDFEWQTTLANRTADDCGCPYLAGKAVWVGFNDLSTTHPELSREWHPSKNGGLKPTNVTAGSNKKVWWYLPYEDPKTGQRFEFEWKSTIYDRAYNNVGCPYISQSGGEQLVRKYFEQHRIAYKQQVKFSELIGINEGNLSYDFAILCNDDTYVLIEYQGIQHYESCNYFGGSSQFAKQKEHDRRKRKFAKENGFKLIEIKYTYNTYEAVSELLSSELASISVRRDFDMQK